MATPRSPSASLLALAALLAVLAVAATWASASQLNLYKDTECQDSFYSCWNNQCCNINDDVQSFKFYYNPDWSVYFFSGYNCQQNNLVRQVSNDVNCGSVTGYKSAKLTDNPPALRMPTDEVA